MADLSGVATAVAGVGVKYACCRVTSSDLGDGHDVQLQQGHLRGRRARIYPRLDCLESDLPGTVPVAPGRCGGCWCWWLLCLVCRQTDKLRLPIVDFRLFHVSRRHRLRHAVVSPPPSKQAPTLNGSRRYTLQVYATDCHLDLRSSVLLSSPLRTLSPCTTILRQTDYTYKSCAPSLRLWLTHPNCPSTQAHPTPNHTTAAHHASRRARHHQRLVQQDGGVAEQARRQEVFRERVQRDGKPNGVHPMGLYRDI